jgi:hypothetical protein
MSRILRGHFQAAKAEYDKLAYDGDLAADVLRPQRVLPRFSQRRWWLLAAPALAASIAVALWMYRPKPTVTSPPTVLAEQVESLTPPAMPSLPAIEVVPPYQQLALPGLPKLEGWYSATVDDDES